ncbi:MAG: coproporphyrinogen III oxidase, partial [Lachnospiraceae bacterium]|nr:coproporphyrinogen III oxidase [Lachnospiraceae bacterium]
VGKKEFYEAFGEEMEAVYGKVIEKLQSQGLVTDGERIRLTPYGRDVSNYVMAEFLFP